MSVLARTSLRLLAATSAAAVTLSLPSAFPVAADVESPPSFDQVPAAEAALARAEAVMSGSSSAVEPPSRYATWRW